MSLGLLHENHGIHHPSLEDQAKAVELTSSWSKAEWNALYFSSETRGTESHRSNLSSRTSIRVCDCGSERSWQLAWAYSCDVRNFRATLLSSADLLGSFFHGKLPLGSQQERTHWQKPPVIASSKSIVHLYNNLSQWMFTLCCWCSALLQRISLW